jgi:serine protease Do
VKGSPAEKAGVKPGDVIVQVDGRAVDGSKAVQRDILGKKIGQRVDLAIWREGKETHLQPTTAELPGEAGEEARAAAGDRSAPKVRLGLGLQTLTPEIAGQLGVDPRTKGVVIAQVRPGSPAQEVGLQRGDLLLAVDQRPVSTAEDAQRALGTDRPGGHNVLVQRGAEQQFLVIPPTN